MNLINKKNFAIGLFLGAVCSLQGMEKSIPNKDEQEQQQNLTKKLFAIMRNKYRTDELAPLIKQGVDLNRKKEESINYSHGCMSKIVTPLWFAIECENIQVIPILIEKGALIDEDVAKHALVKAFGRQRVGPLKLLIENGADFGFLPQINVFHLMMILAENECVISIVNMLMKNKIDINRELADKECIYLQSVATDLTNSINKYISTKFFLKSSTTPLCLAIKVCNNKLIILLIRHGVKVAQKNSNGDTALSLAKYLDKHGPYKYSGDCFKKIIALLLNHHHIYITHSNMFQKFNQHFDLIFNYQQIPWF